MRTKVTLVLVFLNVALFFFIFKFERRWRVEETSTEARRRVLGAEGADISVLEVTNASGTSFRLERQRDNWSLKKPLDWPANPHAVSSIVHALQLLEHEASFTVADAAKNGQALADFGLDKPKLVVAFGSGDAAPGAGKPPAELKIGDASKDGKRLYVLSPKGERIHVVNRSLLDSLSLPLQQLRADTLLTVRVFEARSLTVQTASTEGAGRGGSARVRILRDINSNRWKFAAPITANGSRTAIELAINHLNALHVKSFPTTSPGTMPSAAPVLRLTLEGNNVTETLFIGEPVAPGATAKSGNAAPDATVDYYAQLEGRNAVFTVAVPAKLMQDLRNAQETLREKRILEFDTRAVTEIVLSAPVQPNLAPVILQRLDPAAGQARDAAPRWQIVRRGEANQAPQTRAADTVAVHRLLERLALLEAKTFQSDAPTSADLEEWGFNRPIREVSLSVTGNSAPIVLRLGTDAARRVYYARAVTPTDAGASIYTVDSEIIESLPLSPTAWRDRAVAEPLPPTARVAALRLTDLASKQVIFQRAFNAAGEPTEPPRDPKAVSTLVAALRQLRAKDFVEGGFGEKVFAAGDERPWRFQLEATISLPAGVGLEQTSVVSLYFTERLGGNLQLAGSKEFDAVFTLEQPVVDALWSLAYGPRDPGPPPPPVEKK